MILSAQRIGLHWVTVDPFLFCAHHNDNYPAGNEKLGPQASLSGRNIGMDFDGRDGWNMYHGDVVPGFPQHPHRGFETISIVRRGLIDHSDSMGAKARFGRGDVQWMTAGKGVVHSEMFPLLNSDGENPLELFQIWLNLPAKDKMVEPYFTMLWNEDIPRVTHTDANGKQTNLMLVAGQLGSTQALAPPPNSWAARAESEILIATIALQPGAEYELPAASAEANRTLYFFDGQHLQIAGEDLDEHAAVAVKPDAPLSLRNTSEAEVELMLMQGRPIGEPVAHHGPFVMNTRQELQQAMLDYSRTRFGGWPWPSDAPVHGATRGRFAQHSDGRVEEPAANP